MSPTATPSPRDAPAVGLRPEPSSPLPPPAFGRKEGTATPEKRGFGEPWKWTWSGVAQGYREPAPGASVPAPGPQVPPPRPASPRPARASLPASLPPTFAPFPTRNKQPAVPAAAARDANRAPGASPGGGGRRGPAAGPAGLGSLRGSPPRSSSGPRQGRRETGLSARPPCRLPPAGPRGEGPRRRRPPRGAPSSPGRGGRGRGPAPQPAAAGAARRCAAGSELRIRTSLAKTVSAPQCTAADSL